MGHIFCRVANFIFYNDVGLFNSVDKLLYSQVADKPKTEKRSTDQLILSEDWRAVYIDAISSHFVVNSSIFTQNADGLRYF